MHFFVYSFFFILNFCFTVVINILPGTLKTLKKQLFFPVIGHVFDDSIGQCFDVINELKEVEQIVDGDGYYTVK